jgi:hypothetical protein
MKSLRSHSARTNRVQFLKLRHSGRRDLSSKTVEATKLIVKVGGLVEQSFGCLQVFLGSLRVHLDNVLAGDEINSPWDDEGCREGGGQKSQEKGGCIHVD